MKVMITEKGNEIMNDIFKNNWIFKASVLDFIQQDEKELLCNLIIKIKKKLEVMHKF
jgi:DNA-binding MarR family transcriptional regulator